MSRDNIFNFLLKKEMFSIGVILYATIFGSELWEIDSDMDLDQKMKSLIVLHNFINIHIEKCDENSPDKLVYQILLKLVPININDVISLDEFVILVDKLANKSKLLTKRKLESEDTLKNKRMRL